MNPDAAFVNSLAEEIGEPIHTYSRAQALEDGLLVDAGPSAREEGFKVPVALTLAAWEAAVAWRQPGGLQETRRLVEVLKLARTRASWALVRREDMSSLLFQVKVVPTGALRPRCLALKLSLGAGDDGESVVTISLPGED